MSYKYVRVGCLPYSQYARATVSVDDDGGVQYSDWWGYEITMLEVFAQKQNFRQYVTSWISSNHLF